MTYLDRTIGAVQPVATEHDPEPHELVVGIVADHVVVDGRHLKPDDAKTLARDILSASYEARGGPSAQAGVVSARERLDAMTRLRKSTWRWLVR